MAGFEIEALVISNERLYQSEGGEPIAWGVFEGDEILFVALTRKKCRRWVKKHTSTTTGEIQ